MFLATKERLLGEIITTFVDGQHGAPVPIVGQLELGVGLILQPLFIGNGGGNLLLGFGQLVAHVDDDLIEHLLGVFRRGDEVIQIRLDQRRKAIEDAHGISEPRGRRPTHAYVT